MKIIPFLDAEHANVLVMLCYEDISFISETECLCRRRIAKLKKEALLCLRAACGEVYRRDVLIDPFCALNYMSVRCNSNIKNITLRIDGKVNIGKKSPKKGNCLPQRSCFPFYMQITIAIFRYCHTDSFSDGSAQSAALLPFIGGPRKFLLTGCRICCILMTKLRLIGQAAKTPPSHGGNRGSIPL